MTPIRTFRCPDELWQQARARAKDMGITVTDVLVHALREFAQ